MWRTVHRKIDHTRGRHSCESRNPENHWIPGQARNDKLHGTYVVMCLILVLFGVGVTAFAGWVQAQPDQMKLDYPEVLGKKQRPPVLFPHLRHLEANLSCTDCHHLYDKGKNVLDEHDLVEGKSGIRCSECHDAKSRPRLREAYHDQCIGCHRKKGGPKLCGECHVKK